MATVNFLSIRTSIYVYFSALKNASDTLVSFFESHLYREISSYFRMYPVEAILLNNSHFTYPTSELA